jgi:hypothetical protein
MQELTPELYIKIKESGVPIVEVSLEDLKSIRIMTEDEVNNIYKHTKTNNNGNSSK